MDEQTGQQEHQPATTKPKNWLVESILVTIFCCLPLGIAGIVFASQVNSKYDSGDYTGAEEASIKAGKWTKWGFFAGLAVVILYAILMAVGIGGGMMNM